MDWRSYKKAGGKYSNDSFSRYGGWASFVKECGDEVKRGGKKRISEPNLDIEIYTDFLKITAHKICIGFDTHIPYHNSDTLNRLLDYCNDNDIRHLIIGGDFIDFKGLYKKETQTVKIDWTEEIQEAVKVIEALSDNFDKIYILKGNHDFRFVRLLDGNNRTDRLYDLLFTNPKIKFSKYWYCIVNDWLYVQHDGNTKVALSKLEKIVAVNRMSMLVGHSHRFALKISDSGHEFLGEGLHLTDYYKHEYTGLKLTDNSKWISGWWCVVDNQIYPHPIHQRIMLNT